MELKGNLKQLVSLYSMKHKGNPVDIFHEETKEHDN